MSNKIAIVAITRHGITLAGKVIAALPGAKLFAPEKVRSEAESVSSHARCYTGKTGDQIAELFAAFDGIIAIVSLGAVVRLIAPHLKSKETDPAVVVLDENNRVLHSELVSEIKNEPDYAPALKALAGPFGQARFCPTGGISLSTAPDWLALEAVLCVGGSWIVPSGPLDPARIETLAREAAALAA